MPDTFIKIASVTVGAGGASSIDFTSIPSTYTDLCVKMSTRSNGAYADIKFQFNGDTGSNYAWKSVRGNGSGIDNSGTASDTKLIIGDTVANADTANTFGNSEIYIPNYTSSNYKSVSADSVGENNATTAYSVLTANLWKSTSAITSIKIYSGTGSLVQYCTAVLYGIKNS